MQNENPRILFLRKTRLREFLDNENSRFVENQNQRILFFLENQNPRILVLGKTRLREFSFCGKRESRNLWKTRILILWKTKIGETCFVENENPRILVSWTT